MPIRACYFDGTLWLEAGKLTHFFGRNYRHQDAFDITYQMFYDTLDPNPKKRK